MSRNQVSSRSCLIYCLHLQNEIWSCRKKINFTNWIEESRAFLHFQIPGVTKREKTRFHKGNFEIFQESELISLQISVLQSIFDFIHFRFCPNLILSPFLTWNFKSKSVWTESSRTLPRYRIRQKTCF